MSTFQYFAYGSNMLTERLVRRCPSAVAVGPATAKGYRLRFAKTGRDGSGKATLVADRDQTVHGVLFAIANNDLDALHRAEGAGIGYDFQQSFRVTGLDGGGIVAGTYIGAVAAYDDSLKPFNWYRALVLAGATQHRLPPYYLDRFRWTSVQPDPEITRPGRIEALDILNSSGFGHLVEAEFRETGPVK